MWSLLFNETCLNERLLPNTHTHIYIYKKKHGTRHTHMFIMTYDNIYIVYKLYTHTHTWIDRYTN